MFAIESIFLGQEVKFETSYQNAQGDMRELEFHLEPLLGENGEIHKIIAMGYDISDIKKNAEMLKRTERELRLFFKYSKDGYQINHLSYPVLLTARLLMKPSKR